MNDWKVTIEKHGSKWFWYTTNSSGGGFGSTLCGPKHMVLARALQMVPEGAVYYLNGVRMVKRTIGGDK